MLALHTYFETHTAFASNGGNKSRDYKTIYGEQAALGISGGCKPPDDIRETSSLHGGSSDDEQFRREQPFVKPGTSRVRASAPVAPRGEI